LATTKNNAAESDPPSALTARALVPWVVGTTVAFFALVALDHFVLHGDVLTTFQDIRPLSPLYAFWMPEMKPASFAFVLAAFVCLWHLPRLLSSRTSAMRFGATLFGMSLVLPLTLFLVREGAAQIGSQFLIYPGEEYFDDALRVRDLRGFLQHYTELVPQLSLHGRVHPPGFATLLYIIGRVISPSPFAAGVAVLLLFAAGVFIAWRAFALVLDRRAARFAAVALLAAPSLLDFACTSMDAVFFTAGTLVIWAAFLSFSDRGRWWHGAMTGLALFAAAFCSFSAAPVALFVGLYGIVLWWNRKSWRLPIQLSIALVSFIAAYGAVRYAVGFDLWESFRVARAQHYEIMREVIGRSVASAYLSTTLGNTAALLIGTGLSVVPLFFRGARRALATPDSRAPYLATVVTLAVVCAGGLYTMETERILMFAMPWLALSAGVAATLSDGAAVFIIAVAWVQALAMEALLFTLW
jgi:hypothetical protein